MSFLDDLTDVGRLRAQLHHTTRAATAAADERAMDDLLTTGFATVLRIEAELARGERELDACLADGPLDDVPDLVRRRRALMLARGSLRGDLRRLTARRRALQVSLAVEAPAPPRGPRRPAS